MKEVNLYLLEGEINPITYEATHVSGPMRGLGGDSLTYEFKTRDGGWFAVKVVPQKCK